MEKRTFCDVNDEIENLVQDITSEVEAAIKYEDTSSLHVVLEDLQAIADKINETQVYVDRMEERLKKYRYAIEELGFKRIR